MISRLFGALVLSMAIVSCGGSDTTGTGGGGGGGGGGGVCAANTFCMAASSFFVNGGGTTLSIAANAPVTWTNGDITDHNVTFDDKTTALAVGSGASGTFSAPVGSSNQRKFAVSGSSHPFHCTIHGLVMQGTVTVL
ncbi:MAG: hypothetical protein M3Z18_00060 [Gemmatimonadota bacterium]|nr:hypothetical protein [Gemmatimonadota bacterium]